MLTFGTADVIHSVHWVEMTKIIAGGVVFFSAGRIRQEDERRLEERRRRG
jgi:hypothetical protein